MMLKSLAWALAGLGLAAAAAGASAQGRAGDVLAIEGGTLIDGNGGAPVADAVVVIEGDRILAAGARGQVTVPRGARRINAGGKFLTPGLIDAKSNYTSAYGEAYLMWGVTTAVASGGGMGDASVAERDAIDHGVLAGPSLILPFGALSGPGADGKRQDDGIPGRTGYVAHSPAEARHFAQQFLSAGAGILTANDGDGPPEIYAAFVDEAHKAGVAAVMRTIGPGTAAREGAQMGADVLIHTGNAGNEMAQDAPKWAKSTIFSPDAYSDMDDAKAEAMIHLLTEHGVALEPDMMAADRGFSRGWARVQREAAAFYAPPALRAYMPPVMMQGLVENTKDPHTYLDGPAYDVRARGFARHTAFLRRFVAAGGHLVAASDVPQSPPGFGLLQELAVFQEDIGLTPMQVLQSATKWSADAFRLNDRGVIAPGKRADILIVASDPSRSALNLRNVSWVIQAGRVVDRRYHPDYLTHTFMMGLTREGGTSFGSPVVEGTRRLAAVKQATWNPKAPRNAGFGIAAGGFDSGLDATPGIESLFPYTVPQGSAATEMTIRGFNFSAGSKLLIDGRPVTAKVLDRTTIAVVLSPSAFARAGKYYIQVKNSGANTTPDWGDLSNSATLIVPYAFTATFSQNRF